MKARGVGALVFLLHGAAQAQPVVLPPGAVQGYAEDERGAQGVLADVERVVTSEESSGWFLDATHLTGLYPVILQTVCRASEGARQRALAALEERSAKAGDPRAVLQQQGGKMTAEVEGALSARRQRDALKVAVDGAARDCPSWIAPVAGYDGRQTDRNRYFLTFESGGLLQLRRTLGEWTYGGGGVGRLLGGYGFGGKVSLLAGVEFAGGAMLKLEDKSSFVVNYFPAVPVVLRVHSVSWHYDFELAGVSLFQAGNNRFSFGNRAGFALGVSALRTRFFLPWAGAVVAYEHYYETGGRPAQDFIRAGLRVGAVWDP